MKSLVKRVNKPNEQRQRRSVAKLCRKLKTQQERRHLNFAAKLQTTNHAKPKKKNENKTKKKEVSSCII